MLDLGYLAVVGIGLLTPLLHASPLGTHESRQDDGWPFGPLVTSGRDIKVRKNPLLMTNQY